MAKHIVISTSVDMIRLLPEHIVYISSDGNYSSIITISGDNLLCSQQLGQLERLIEEQLGIDASCFIRIGKCLIVNKNFVSFINISQQKLLLLDCIGHSHAIKASREALKRLKEYIEKEATYEQ